MTGTAPSREELGLRCSCCGAYEGGNPTGGAVDPVSGLCMTCQPCPRCGEMGLACWDDGGRGFCERETFG